MDQQKLVYLCSSVNCTIKSLLTQRLSSSYFIRINSVSESEFVKDSLSVLQSNGFVFVLSKKTIRSTYCLNLLGMAVSYDVPIIAVRKMGYGKDRATFKRFQEEIVDRSRQDILEYNSLRVVTTLEKVLCTLYDHSLAYHKNVAELFIEKLCAMILNFPTSQYKGIKEKICSQKINDKNNLISSKFEEKKITHSNLVYSKNKELKLESTKYKEKKVDLVVTKNNEGREPECSTKKKRSVRRHSSLPQIKTNYLVSGPGEHPSIYIYPPLVSQDRLYVKRPSTSDELDIHISRRCSSIDLSAI